MPQHRDQYDCGADVDLTPEKPHARRCRTLSTAILGTAEAETAIVFAAKISRTTSRFAWVARAVQLPAASTAGLPDRFCELAVDAQQDAKELGIVQSTRVHENLRPKTQPEKALLGGFFQERRGGLVVLRQDLCENVHACRTLKKMALLLHELWVEPDGLETFCLAGPMGDAARKELQPGSKLVWSVKAGSHFEAMTKYYAHQGRGEYTTQHESDHKPYPDDWLVTQRLHDR